MEEFSSKEVIETFLSLSLKLNEMDETVATEIEFLNTLPQEQYEVNNLYNSTEISILRNVDTMGEEYLSFIESVIDSMTFIDNEYIKHMIQVRKLNIQPSIESLKEQIEKEVPRFRTQNHDFMYHHAVSVLAIGIGDSDLIRKAIERVQAL